MMATPLGEEVRRRISDNCQMLMSKACRIKQNRLEAVKVLRRNFLLYFSLLISKNTYFSFFYLSLVYKVVTILFLLCQYGVLSVD